LCRSPRIDENGATIADDNMRTAISNPTAVAPPAWYAKTESATA